MNVHDKAVLSFSEEIERTIFSKVKKVVTPSTLHERLLVILQGLGESTAEKPSEYPSWKLKQKLKKRFGDRMLFISQTGKSDLVCSNEVTVGDLVKKVSALNIQINESGDYEFGSCDESDQLDNAVILHQAAGILRDSISGKTFQSNHYNPSGQFEKYLCKSFIPETLYDFIAWWTSKQHFDNAKTCKSSSECCDDSVADLKVLGICHSIIALSCKIQYIPRLHLA